MQIVATSLLVVGLTGVLIAALLNTYVVVGRGRHAEMFFSQSWWSRWFPMYVVMGAAGFVGLALLIAGN
jgi:hypothetical protein